jgi:hypothetical protein
MILSVIGIGLFLFPGFLLSQRYFQGAQLLVQLIASITISIALYFGLIMLITVLQIPTQFGGLLTLGFLCSGAVLYWLHKRRW